MKPVRRKLGPISYQIELDGNGNGNQVWFTLPSYELRSVKEKEEEVEEEKKFKTLIKRMNQTRK